MVNKSSDALIVGGKFHLDLSLLKVIGLLCVILAHVQGIPEWLAQLRTFDVTLLCLISGRLAYKPDYFEKLSLYYKKRFSRLLLPAWTFLTIFVVFSWLSGHVMSFKSICNSYLLQYTGLTGIWVISVYLGCSVLAPCFYKLIKNQQEHHIAAIFIIFLVVYEIAVTLIYNENNALNRTLFYIFGYSIAYFVGMLIQSGKITVNRVIPCTGVFLPIFAIVIALFGRSPLTMNEFKYPPHLYYLCYGIFVSCLLICAVEYISKAMSGSSNCVIGGVSS